MKPFKALAAALVAALALTGCAPEPDDYTAADRPRVECDTADQREYDDDCGYWDNSGYWTFWYWVRPGGTSYSPAGWVRDYPRGTTAGRPSNAKLSAKPRRQQAPAKVSHSGSVGAAERRAESRRQAANTKQGGSSRTRR